jgi:methylthioribulose-1-phosphate dehydratase
MLKAFSGNTTHAMMETVKVLPNSQDMAAFCEDLARLFDAGDIKHGFLMAGHGLYTWGASLAEAKRHIEAFEFLLSVEMEKRRWRK